MCFSNSVVLEDDKKTCLYDQSKLIVKKTKCLLSLAQSISHSKMEKESKKELKKERKKERKKRKKESTSVKDAPVYA